MRVGAGGLGWVSALDASPNLASDGVVGVCFCDLLLLEMTSGTARAVAAQLVQRILAQLVRRAAAPLAQRVAAPLVQRVVPPGAVLGAVDIVAGVVPPVAVLVTFAAAAGDTITSADRLHPRLMREAAAELRVLVLHRRGISAAFRSAAAAFLFSLRRFPRLEREATPELRILMIFTLSFRQPPRERRHTRRPSLALFFCWLLDHDAQDAARVLGERGGLRITSTRPEEPCELVEI
mmetsp:Transcript_41833/g.131099  ORF Transcript_41833/g.131099 Transcript_41833/m.131099 type:complete len:236 (-) Transcript_41833:1287-1994(-)